MGPAVETFLQAFAAAAVCLLVVAWAGRPFWRRVGRFFRRWMEADRLRDEELARQAECRRVAEQEVDSLLSCEPTPGTTSERKAEVDQPQDQERR